jgi:hypothetical protein
VISSLLLLHLFGPNIFLNTLSQTPSLYVPSLMSENKFHTHTEPHPKNCFISIPLILYSYSVEVFIFLWIYTQSVGLLGRAIDPSQGLYLNTGQHKHRITHTHTHTHTHKTSMSEVEFEPMITACELAKTVHVLDRSTIVTGSSEETYTKWVSPKRWKDEHGFSASEIWSCWNFSLG